MPNALQGLVAREGLTREIMERVEGAIAQQGLHQAITKLTNYYTAVPSGRAAVDDIAAFVEPPLAAARNRAVFAARWSPGGFWAGQ